MASPVFIIIITITFFITLLQTIPQYSHSAPLVLPLSHTLPTTATPHHLLKSTTTRSAARFHRRSRVSLPLSPGSDYTLSLSLGSQTISLYMDTGSDVVWLPCHPFDCILCEGKYSPSAIPHPGPLNLTSTPTIAPVTCKSSACSAVHSHLPSSDICTMANCPLESIEISDCKEYHCPNFYFAYGDGSFVGKLYEDSLVIPKSQPALKLPKFTFGCAHSALGEPIGVAGFGRGSLSLPAQLAKTAPEIGNYFSYCLITHVLDTSKVRRPSPLILGRWDNRKNIKDGTDSDDNSDGKETADYSYTPLLYSPKHAYFYCIGLEAVTIGHRKIPSPESLRTIDEKGNGGMVVDSGTTFTMLLTKFYESVVSEFDKRVGSVYERAGEVEGTTGLSPCYYANEGDKYIAHVPRLVMHFGGNATVAMPRRNYFYEFFDAGKKRRVGCLMVLDGGDEAENGGGPAGLLGNYQQQGFEVVYDLEMERVGFAKRKCANLWDTLKRG